MRDAVRGDAAFVSIYVLPLRHGKFYVGKTSDPARRNAQHRSPSQRQCVWVNRHGPPVADLRVVSTVKARNGSGEEDRVTAQQLWDHGPNAARGGQLAGETDEFTLNDLRRLTSFIGHTLDKSFSTVEQRLRSQLMPLSAGRQQHAQQTTAAVVQRRCEDGCGERTSRPDHPLCYRCYTRRKEENTLWESTDEEDEDDEEGDDDDDDD